MDTCAIMAVRISATYLLSTYDRRRCPNGPARTFEPSRDEYYRIEQIKLAKDVTLIEEELPIYRGPRKGNGSLIFNTSCKIRVEIPKFLLDSKSSDFEYGSFKIIE